MFSNKKGLLILFCLSLTALAQQELNTEELSSNSTSSISPVEELILFSTEDGRRCKTECIDSGNFFCTSSEG